MAETERAECELDARAGDWEKLAPMPKKPELPVKGDAPELPPGVKLRCALEGQSTQERERGFRECLATLLRLRESRRLDSLPLSPLRGRSRRNCAD